MTKIWIRTNFLQNRLTSIFYIPSHHITVQKLSRSFVMGISKTGAAKSFEAAIFVQFFIHLLFVESTLNFFKFCDGFKRILLNQTYQNVGEQRKPSRNLADRQITWIAENFCIKGFQQIRRLDRSDRGEGVEEKFEISQRNQ